MFRFLLNYGTFRVPIWRLGGHFQRHLEQSLLWLSKRKHAPSCTSLPRDQCLNRAPNMENVSNCKNRSRLSLSLSRDAGRRPARRTRARTGAATRQWRADWGRAAPVPSRPYSASPNLPSRLCSRTRPRPAPNSHVSICPFSRESPMGTTGTFQAPDYLGTVSSIVPTHERARLLWHSPQHSPS